MSEDGKIARAYAVSAQIEAGNVYVPHPSLAAWVYAYLQECTAFPNGAYDDQVDQTTQGHAASWLLSNPVAAFVRWVLS